MISLTKETINPEKYYSASQIAGSKLLPWTSVMTFTAKLRDPAWQSYFNPLIEQGQHSIRYKIKGSALLTVLRLIENGEI